MHRQSVASVNGSLITARCVAVCSNAPFPSHCITPHPHRLNKLAAVIPRILVTDILLPSSTDASAWANALLRFVRTAAVHPSVMEVSMRCVVVCPRQALQKYARMSHTHTVSCGMASYSPMVLACLTTAGTPSHQPPHCPASLHCRGAPTWRQIFKGL